MGTSACLALSAVDPYCDACHHGSAGLCASMRSRNQFPVLEFSKCRQPWCIRCLVQACQHQQRQQQQPQLARLGGFAAPSARRLLAAFAVDGTFTTTEYSAAFPNPGNAFYASDAVVVANPTWFSFPRTCSGGRGCGNTNSPNVS